MSDWTEPVKRMAEWIDAHLAEECTFADMAREIGYSPAYCSTQFHRLTGLTLRAYAMQRRLYRAAIAIRETDARLLDIALDCGYETHEALTTAFRRAYGVTPDAYRRSGKLIRLPLPFRHEEKGGEHMLTEPNLRVEYVPAHRFLGVFHQTVQNGEPVWPGHDCDLVTHTVESLAHHSDVIVTAHTAGWRLQEGARSYFYGLGVPEEYAGPVPAGFELLDVPAGYYQVVSHPPFAFPEDNAEVMQRIERKAFGSQCAVKGFRWQLEGLCYQRHDPEGHGCMVLRPITRA